MKKHDASWVSFCAWTHYIPAGVCDANADVHKWKCGETGYILIRRSQSNGYTKSSPSIPSVFATERHKNCYSLQSISLPLQSWFTACARCLSQPRLASARMRGKSGWAEELLLSQLLLVCLISKINLSFNRPISPD